MSRIGQQSITIPAGVTVKKDGSRLLVEGPLGKLTQKIHRQIKVEIKENQISFKRKKETKIAKAMHGTTRNLTVNMVEGVTKGFSKILEIHGTGYRAKMDGNKLVVEVGFSHPVTVEPPAGIQFAVKAEKEIKVSGIDKQLVGNVAAKVRKVKKPEPYKGKGIRYQGEVIKLKQGKAAKVGAGGGVKSRVTVVVEVVVVDVDVVETVVVVVDVVAVPVVVVPVPVVVVPVPVVVVPVPVVVVPVPVVVVPVPVVVVVVVVATTPCAEGS